MIAEPDPAAQTALLVPVPAAEPAVGRHRRSLDPSAGWGVPAHVTVLFPFLPPSLVSDSVVARIEQTLRGVPAFDFALDRTEWFGDQVVWLAPEPDEPFRRLIRTLSDAFPECPPYGGAYDEQVPHLTIGQRSDDAALAALQVAAASVATCLPLRTTADTILLMTGRREPLSWRTAHTFPLTRSP